MDPRCVADYACHTGEGPLWHPTEKRLYWVDIPAGRLLRYDPASGRHEQCFESDEAIGGFTIQEDGALLLFMARGAVRLWRERIIDTVIDEIAAERDSRFNDVIADPAGRVFCGTMRSPDHGGRLYRLDTDGSLRVLLEDQGCPNGMGFTADLKQMYYTDSVARHIYAFDYEQASGELSNQRVLVEVPRTPGEGVPDGMAVDAAGDLWSARWDGCCLVHYSPLGEELERLPFPAKKVSSVTFGGEDYSDMYVTTAGGNDKAEEGAQAGGLFVLSRGVVGRPEYCSRIGRR